ncbi:MAG: hypothetical protein Q8L74_12825 [Nitrospirota bacterium]|nr:hypothetical protein [Nitrospirota bacterium]
MNSPWHKADPSLLVKIGAEVQELYPNLHFYPQNDRVVVRGSLPIIDVGKELDRYSVEIVLLADYPNAVPLVRETGGKIPRHADHHVDKESGEACLFVPDERWKIYPPGTTFLEFLNGPVRNFFLGQSVFRRTGEWPFGQRSHGSAGILEYYAELLGMSEVTVILGYLEYLSRPTLKGHWPCPCKSGKRIRDCHRHQINELRTKISRKLAEKSYRLLRNDIDKILGNHV